MVLLEVHADLFKELRIDHHWVSVEFAEAVGLVVPYRKRTEHQRWSLSHRVHLDLVRHSITFHDPEHVDGVRDAIFVLMLVMVQDFLFLLWHDDSLGLNYIRLHMYNVGLKLIAVSPACTQRDALAKQ